MAMEKQLHDMDAQPELDERIVDITRVAKVVKGGRHLHFRVVAVVGDNKGQVGLGIGKARNVPDAIAKATDRARRDMRPVALDNTTITHEITGTCGGSVVFLRPAAPGTGVIAAGAVRAILEAAGVRDVLTKSQGSPTKINVAQATMKALRDLRSAEEVAQSRGVAVENALPFWRRRKA